MEKKELKPVEVHRTAISKNKATATEAPILINTQVKSTNTEEERKHEERLFGSNKEATKATTA